MFGEMFGDVENILSYCKSNIGNLCIWNLKKETWKELFWREIYGTLMSSHVYNFFNICICQELCSYWKEGSLTPKLLQ